MMAGNASQTIASAASAATPAVIQSVKPMTGTVRAADTMTATAAASAIIVAAPIAHATVPIPSHCVVAKPRAQAKLVNP